MHTLCHCPQCMTKPSHFLFHMDIALLCLETNLPSELNKRARIHDSNPSSNGWEPNSFSQAVIHSSHPFPQSFSKTCNKTHAHFIMYVCFHSDLYQCERPQASRPQFVHLCNQSPNTADAKWCVLKMLVNKYSMDKFWCGMFYMPILQRSLPRSVLPASSHVFPASGISVLLVLVCHCHHPWSPTNWQAELAQGGWNK